MTTILIIIAIALAATIVWLLVRRKQAPVERSGSGVDEKKLVQNAIDFRDLKVRDCMVPRIDIEAVDINTTIKELADRFRLTQYSRVLIFDGSIDNIIGYVTSKSLFGNPKSISDILLNIDHVAETMPAQKMLTKFIARKSTLAVVIDEFGGTAGIVSLEDILEEIFGEIEDEYDSTDMIEKVIGPNEYLLSCRLEIDYLDEKYSLGLGRSEQYTTLAGYIITNFQGIPKPGEVIKVEDKEIRIIRAGGSRLDLARVKKSGNEK